MNLCFICMFNAYSAALLLGAKRSGSSSLLTLRADTKKVISNLAVANWARIPRICSVFPPRETAASLTACYIPAGVSSHRGHTAIHKEDVFRETAAFTIINTYQNKYVHRKLIIASIVNVIEFQRTSVAKININYLKCDGEDSFRRDEIMSWSNLIDICCSLV